jgi:hypothetical protein
LCWEGGVYNVILTTFRPPPPPRGLGKCVVANEESYCGVNNNGAGERQPMNGRARRFVNRDHLKVGQ